MHVTDLQHVSWCYTLHCYVIHAQVQATIAEKKTILIPYPYSPPDTSSRSSPSPFLQRIHFSWNWLSVVAPQALEKGILELCGDQCKHIWRMRKRTHKNKNLMCLWRQVNAKMPMLFYIFKYNSACVQGTGTLEKHSYSFKMNILQIRSRSSLCCELSHVNVTSVLEELQVSY